jgi:hypothetical protein
LANGQGGVAGGDTRPEVLTTAASSLGGMVARLNSTIDVQRNAARDLQSSWQGAAAEAALSRAASGYTGFPAANTACKVAREVFDEQT